jgi:hypothetical protein
MVELQPAVHTRRNYNSWDFDGQSYNGRAYNW